MLFNSYLFLFLFLPLTLLGYYTLNRFGKYTLASIYMTLMSLWFYGYSNPWYLSLLVVSILANYGLHMAMMHPGTIRHPGVILHQGMIGHKDMPGQAETGKRFLLALGIVLNLGLLFYFKYYDFFVENLNAVFGSSFVLKKILLPLGISFFTFQQLSFLVDTYRGETPKYRFTEYALFVSFFPQLVAGPIVNHSEMIAQFRDENRKKFGGESMQRGIMLFVFGLAKKVVLADTLGQAVNWGYTYHYVLDATNGILIATLYAFQLYLDFSGYCDMARGIGLMFRIDLPVNFDSPYKSAGIIEFWRRWHITLGRFFTKYVYIPLGGSRKGKFRTCINSFIVFFLSGIWHGANWTFVFWGVLHGIGYITEYLAKPLWEKVPRIIRILITFCFVDLAFAAFRAADLRQAFEIYDSIFSGQFGKPFLEIALFFQREEFNILFRMLHLENLPYVTYYPAVFMILLCTYLIFLGKNAGERVEKCKFGVCSALATSALFLYCVVCLSKVSTFLYFNF